MKSSTTPSFRSCLRALPPRIRRLARKTYKLWERDPRHGSLQFKKTGVFWSVRVGDHYRALARWTGEEMEWFWIGAHGEYDRLLKQG